MLFKNEWCITVCMKKQPDEHFLLEDFFCLNTSTSITCIRQPELGRAGSFISSTHLLGWRQMRCWELWVSWSLMKMLQLHDRDTFGVCPLSGQKDSGNISEALQARVYFPVSAVLAQPPSHQLVSKPLEESCLVLSVPFLNQTIISLQFPFTSIE